MTHSLRPVRFTRTSALFLGALALALTSIGGISNPAHAATTSLTLDGVKYTVDPDEPAVGAAVTGYDRWSVPSDLSIPSVVTIGDATYPVTSIGESAFQSAKLTSVTIPDSVASISDAAFYSNRLASVHIPDSVTSIGAQAFINNSLTSVRLPQGLTEIKVSTFVNNRLTQVDIPDTVTTIGPGAFSGNLLDSVTIPSSVTVVSDDAFSSNRLTSVELSPGLTAIGVSAFEYNNLTSVTVPAGVARIGQRAFGSNNLTEVTLLGAAPEIRQAGSSSPYLGSFGDPRGVVVRFPQQFSADVAGEGGYTFPLWQGYDTESFSRGTLTLEAELLGADGRDVALQVSAADPTGEILVEGVPGDAAVTGVTVAAGTYTLSSALPQAALDATDGTFVSDGWTCVAADGSPVTVSAANEVEVGAGDDLTCVAIHRFIADEEEDGDPVTADPDDTTGGEAAVSDTTTSDAGAGDAGPAAASRGLARTGAELPAAGLLALLALVGTLAVRGRHLIGH